VVCESRRDVDDIHAGDPYVIESGGCQVFFDGEMIDGTAITACVGTRSVRRMER
jgi:hypothetical protein